MTTCIRSSWRAAALMAACSIANAQQSREDIASSGDYVVDGGTQLLGPGNFVTALDVNPAWVTNATLSGPAAGAAALPNFGVIQPRRGSSLVTLSTGIVGGQAEPGADFAPTGVLGDEVLLTLQFDPPEGATKLHFDFLFLSSEYPDFVLAGFNDTFTARVFQGSVSQTIALANVDSSFFIPVSSPRAGGTGYNLYTEDPSGVDTTFGVGLPDAGVTVWQSVDVDVPFEGPFFLQFRIADVGDGILDSAVVLDNLVLTAMELLDPAELVLSNGSIETDPNQLATRGTKASAIAADGVSRMLVRATLPSAGAAVFSLEEGANGNGGFALPGSDAFAASVSTSTVEVNGRHVAFAVYRAPENFDSGGSSGVGRRDLTVKLDFNGSQDSFESQRGFSLTRPPVLLVHGLWSNAGTWTFPLATDPRYFVFAGDYQATNDRPFATNLLRPRQFIRNIRALLQNNKEIAVQVDYAGHSMGGILGRNHINSQFYRTRENYFEGDVNRFVTLNTPHLGSPLGNLSVAIMSVPVLGDLFTSAVSAIIGDPSAGAVADLSVGGPAILSIGATNIPGHAMVGTGGSDVLMAVPGWIGAFYRVVKFFAPLGDVFQGLQHDGIVGRLSQEGGITSSAQSIFGGLGSIHTSATRDGNYSTRLNQLLALDPSDSQFASFPAAASAFNGPILPSGLSGHMGLLGPISISSPANGANVVSGSSVTFAINDPTGTLTRAAIVGPGIFEVDEDAPFSINAVIPTEAIGPITVYAIGATAADEYYTSAPLALNVTTPATLQSVRILPQNVVFTNLGETMQVTVLGTYSNGQVRDITRLPGMTYQSSIPSIASVNSSGLVTPLVRGTSTLIARIGLRQDSVSIDVLDGPQFATPFCQCASSAPCGNTDAFAGCRNSTGAGARLDVASGSSSILQDNMILRVDGLAPNTNGLLFVGFSPNNVPLADGRLCVSPGPGSFGGYLRFPVRNSGSNGVFFEGPGLVASANARFGANFITVGTTRYFQAYYRDPQGPCGSGANMSNGLAVTFDL